MTTIASICARGGSKGVPGKNIRPLLGKPLIAWTIEQALQVPAIQRVVVSTDSQDIAAVADRAGAEVPFLRPPELATDDARKIPVLQHMVRHLENAGPRVSRIVDLDPTSPLRDVADIEACLALMTGDVDVVITGYAAERNPYFNMVEPQPTGGYDLVKRPTKTFARRQDAPQVYSMNASIYEWRDPALLVDGLFGPHTRLHVMPRERSIDIDSEIDFALVELLMKRKMGT